MFGHQLYLIKHPQVQKEKYKKTKISKLKKNCDRKTHKENKI